MSFATAADGTRIAYAVSGDLLPSIATPTLVLHGADDQINVVANAHKLASQIPNVSLHILPDARHYFWDHRPAASDIVLAFLAASRVAGRAAVDGGVGGDLDAVGGLGGR